MGVRQSFSTVKPWKSSLTSFCARRVREGQRVDEAHGEGGPPPPLSLHDALASKGTARATHLDDQVLGHLEAGNLVGLGNLLDAVLNERVDLRGKGERE